MSRNIIWRVRDLFISVIERKRKEVVHLLSAPSPTEMCTSNNSPISPCHSPSLV